MFMNEYDIEEAKSRHRRHPVLSKATVLLFDLMTLANSVSDGWPYWTKPSHAARKLMELIERGTANSLNNYTAPEVTEADLKKAVAPIKSFLTREKANLKGHTLNLPC